MHRPHRPPQPVYEPCTGHIGRTGLNIQHTPAVCGMSHLRFCRATLTQRHPNCWKPCLFVARCDKVAACDYEVARCDFVARQSRASKSRDKIAGVTWH